MSKFLYRLNWPITSEMMSSYLIGLFALFALFLQNSSWHTLYLQVLHMPLFILRWSGTRYTIDVMHIVNEVLMVCFFALVSIEIKKEFCIGIFREARYALLPCIAALGGVLIPAIFYLLFNGHDPVLRTGWAIPTATDIVISLAILSLLGQQVPITLRILLTTIAIVDDVCAILIIAIAYTGTMQGIWIIASILGIGLLYGLNRYNVQIFSPYLLVGLLLWGTILQSGMHATIAGVLWAAFIPLQSSYALKRPALLYRVENIFRPMVDYLILPAFAFVNTGIPLYGINWHNFSHPVFLGTFLGLVVGKPLGILFGASFVIMTGITPLPVGIYWRHLISIACLGGIGFTMSFLMSLLAFSEDFLLILARQAILLASLCSAIIGLYIFPKASARQLTNGS